MPPELPRGLSPYVCLLEISPLDFAERIRHEVVEVAAAFDQNGKMTARPREGSADRVKFEEEENLTDSLVIHNHPLGGAPSHKDGLFAVVRNTMALWIVQSDGVVFVIERPEDGWPPSHTVEEAMRRALLSLANERARRARAGEAPLTDKETQDYLFSERRIDLGQIGVKMEKRSVWDLQ